jgi:tyrosine-specific transport protein
MKKERTILGGALLVAGTTIGGGMLALPVLTSPTGFLPSIVVYILCWAFMSCTALLFLEASLWMKKESNILSMAEYTLGGFAKGAAWALYIFLFYCLTLAYIVGCGSLLSEFFSSFTALSWPSWTGPLIFVLLFAPIVFLGSFIVGRVNFCFMIGLIFLYFAFVALGYRYINPENLLRSNWSMAVRALPIAFISFAFQGIIPTLVSHYDHNPRKIRAAILIGSFIPLVTYIVWEWLILGIVPFEGKESLSNALANGENAVHPLKNIINNPLVYTIGRYFAFIAMLTSFLGVTLGLLDFWADGLKVEKTIRNKLLLSLLVFIPPLLIAFAYPHVFLIALEFAGGFGSALLLGLLPILMVWRGRYHLNLKAPYSLIGGKPLLILLALFVLFELLSEIYRLV